jgi:hypothetical protein
MLRRWVGLALGIFGGLAAQCGQKKTDCPLQVRRISLSGRTPTVLVQNRADHPIGNIVFHVAYEDLFPKYHELTVPVDTVLQAGQKVTLPLQPINTSVEWETLQIYATCQRPDTDHPADSTPSQ